jgi:hypothetical protein
MRDDVRQILSDANLAMDVIIKGKDTPEAKSMIVAARLALCSLADEYANLPEEEPEPVAEEEVQVEEAEEEE